MKNQFISLITITILLSFQLQAQQSPTWTYTLNAGGLNGGTIFQQQPYASSIEQDNSIMFLTGNTIHVTSHYGELINEINLETPDMVSSGPSRFYFFDHKIDNGTDYFIAAQRGGITGNTYLQTVFMDGSTGVQDFELADDVQSDELEVGHAAVIAEDGDYLFFGQSKIYKVRVVDPYTINVIWIKDKEPGPVSAVEQEEDGYIVAGTNGLLAKYNLEGDLQWVKDLLFAIYDIAIVDDGYITCGEIAQVAWVKKTNFAGFVLWQKIYDEEKIYTVLPTADGGILFAGKSVGLNGGFVLKTDEFGTELWKKENEGNAVHLNKSKYGGYFLQSFGLGGQAFNRYFDEEGESEGGLIDKTGRRLDVNNISAACKPTGQLFSSGSSSSTRAAYMIQNDLMASTIFMSHLWIAAMDENQELHVSAPTYLDEVFAAGPRGTTDYDFWNQTWNVNRIEAQEFAHEMSTGPQSRPIPLSLLWWPGIGNPNIKYNNTNVIIDQNYAPFEDVNADGIYNIYDGDYPIVKGDEMLWWMMNDQEFEPGFIPLDIELSCMLYAYDCGDELLQNATFLEMEIHNKSEHTYDDVRLGLWTDFDLGCYTDDFVGSLPEQNTYFVYNESIVDPLTCASGINGFGEEIPLQSITFLNKEMANSMYGNASLSSSNLPLTPEDHFDFMQSIWADGEPLTIGGDGHNPGSTALANHFFFGNPSEAGEWSMCSAGLEVGDQRVVGAATVSDFEPLSTIYLHFGMLTHPDYAHPCPDMTMAKQNLEALQSLYDDHISTGLDATYILDLGPDGLAVVGELLDAGDWATSYLWSTGETTSTIIPVTVGEHAVTITTPLGCTQVDVVDVGLTGTKELLAKPLEIYPNPTRGNLRIDFSEEVPFQIKVLNLQGQQLKIIDTSQKLAGTSLEIKLPFGHAGVYILQSHYRNSRMGINKVALVD